ncbi:MAG: hypothetical protein QXR92_04150 [Fervidicoccaceae archaeon]
MEKGQVDCHEVAFNQNLILTGDVVGKIVSIYDIKGLRKLKGKDRDIPAKC